jgi:predicted nucleic acid-binding protein
LAASLVIDNSIVMAWCFLDERTEYVGAVKAFLENNTAIQPVVWPLEAGNVVTVAVRRKRISREDGSLFLSLLESLPIEVESGSPSRMFREVYALAEEHQLSTYDASYLDLALRRELPLATQDKALIRAAAECGVALFQP